MQNKPYRFRAIHTKNAWRKASHETFERATTIGNRSALALFEYRNKAIDYSKAGDPLYVVVWHKDEEKGWIFKSNTDGNSGICQSSHVSRPVIDEWETQREAPKEQLESYFAMDKFPLQNSGHVAQTSNSFVVKEPVTMEGVLEQLSSAISDSALITREARLLRLKTANRLPKKIEVVTYAFIRNADVIIEALERANGKCERCCLPAPFDKSKDGAPYLEVHHIVQLSKGGEDIVSNTLALCPNCHRYLHYGE